MKKRLPLIIFAAVFVLIQCSIVGTAFSVYFVKSAPSKPTLKERKASIAKALKYDPQNGFARMEFARLLVRDNELVEATHQARLATKTYNSVLTYIQLGAIYRRRGGYEIALDYLNKSLRMWPRNTDTLLQVAQIYIDAKDYKSAISALNRTLDEDPRNKTALYQLSERYRVLEDYERQAFFLRKVLLVENNVYDEATLYQLARVYVDKLNQPENAIRYVRGLLKISALNPPSSGAQPDYKLQTYYKLLHRCLVQVENRWEANEIAREYRRTFKENIE